MDVANPLLFSAHVVICNSHVSMRSAIKRQCARQSCRSLRHSHVPMHSATMFQCTAQPRIHTQRSQWASRNAKLSSD